MKTLQDIIQKLLKRADYGGTSFIAMARAIASNPLLLCSFAGNFILCSLGLLAAPAAYRETAAGLQRPVQMLILAASILAAILFAAAMGYLARGGGTDGMARGFARCFKRSGCFAGCFIGAVLLYSLLCGSFSVLIYLLLQNMLSYAAVKSIINIITCITTLAAAPLVLMELFAFTFFELPVKETIRAGLGACRQGYKKLLLIMAAFVLLGGILAIGIGLIRSGLLRGAVTLAAYTLIGGIGTYVACRAGIEALSRTQSCAAQDFIRGCQMYSLHEKQLDYAECGVQTQRGPARMDEKNRFVEAGNFGAGDGLDRAHEEKQAGKGGWVRQILEENHSDAENEMDHV